MENGKINSRIAGLLYLVVVVTGMFSLAYVPKQLFVWDNPSLTFQNISNSEILFRVSILSSVICYITFIFLPVYLYKLLKSVNKFMAKIMVILAIISVPISLMNLQHKYDILSLIESAQTQRIVPKQEVYNQLMLFLNQYDNGILIATVFWGLWLLPFGYLVYKSGFLPKILGILLILGCFGYLINFCGNTLSNNYGALGIKAYFGLLPAIGEIGICLWLLLVGAKNRE